MNAKQTLTVEAASEKMLRTLRMVHKGFHQGALPDPALIDQTSRGPNAEIRPLSAIVDEAIASAEQAGVSG